MTNLFEPHAMNRLQIWAPDLSGKTRTDVDFRYITTDRIVLNRMLRQQAVEAGAHIFYNHRADGLVGITDAPLGGIRIGGLRVTDRHQERKRAKSRRRSRWMPPAIVRSCEHRVDSTFDPQSSLFQRRSGGGFSHGPAIGYQTKPGTDDLDGSLPLRCLPRLFLDAQASCGRD